MYFAILCYNRFQQHKEEKELCCHNYLKPGFQELPLHKMSVLAVRSYIRFQIKYTI